ncbi:uncharacterized protein RJT20DRAFT_31422 [Scheffersomyces xylosifermentans]|uniref:uncharacterized protein n=1 Tax=Scheffersomyces xylosifermentans TaxID=1304137 RepID=UPI00315CAFB1
MSSIFKKAKNKFTSSSSSIDNQESDDSSSVSRLGRAISGRKRPKNTKSSLSPTKHTMAPSVDSEEDPALSPHVPDTPIERDDSHQQTEDREQNNSNSVSQPLEPTPSIEVHNSDNVLVPEEISRDENLSSTDLHDSSERDRESAIKLLSSEALSDHKDKGQFETHSLAETTSASASPFITSQQQTSKSKAVETLEEELVDELQPLLQASSYANSGSVSTESVELSPQSEWGIILFLKNLLCYLDMRDPKLVHYIVLLVLILFGLTYFTIRNLDVLIKQSVTFNLDNVSVQSFNDDGLDARVVGSVYVDYDEVSNIIYRNLLKIGSLVLATVTISPNKEMKLYAKPTSSGGSPLHMVNTFPPPITIDILNKHVTDLDFISTATFVKENIIKLARDIERSPGKDIDLDVQGVLSADVKAGMFHFEVNDVNVYETVNIPKDKFKPVIDIEELNAIASDGIRIDARISIENILPFDFNLDTMFWDVLLENCENKLATVGNWQTSQVFIRPSLPIKVDIKGKIASIPKELLEDCKTRPSAITRLLQNYLDNKPMEVFLRASEHQVSELPKWLFYLLHNAEHKLSVVVPRTDMVPQQIGLAAAEVFIPESNSLSSKFEVHVSSNVSAIVDFPFDFLFNIPNFKNKFMVKLDNSNTELIEGHSDSKNYMIIRQVFKFLHISAIFPNLHLHLLNPKEIGKLINSYLHGKRDIHKDMYGDLEIDNLSVQLPIGDIVVSKLKFDHLSVSSEVPSTDDQELERDEIDVGIHEIDSSEDHDFDSGLDELINSLNISILNIIYVDSTKNGVELLIDLEMKNPTNFSLDIPKEEITIGIRRNDSCLGHAVVSDVFVPKYDRFNLTSKLEVLAQSTKDRLVLEQFLSEFISGRENLTVDMANHDVKNNMGLRELIQQIEIPEVKIPSVNFTRKEADQHQEISVLDHPSPFLIDATIHILTSEVELTLYNPISNAELQIEIYQADAKHGDIILGHILHQEYLLVPPGVYRTSRIPIKINPIGMTILKKAINGELEVEVITVFTAILDKFEVQLMYKGHGLNTHISL